MQIEWNVGTSNCLVIFLGCVWDGMEKLVLAGLCFNVFPLTNCSKHEWCFYIGLGWISCSDCITPNAITGY